MGRKKGRKNFHKISFKAFQTIGQCIQFVLKNKTNNTIYVDLGNSFIIRGSEASPYYVPSSTTQSSESSSGVGVNLGAVAGAIGVGGALGTLASGVNVGGGSSNGSMTTTYSQRIISIPPMSSKKFGPQYFFPMGQNVVYGMKVLTDCYSKVNNRTYINTIPLKWGDIKKYDETSSPIKISSFITYSLSPDLSKTYSIKTSLYVNNAIGLPRHTGGYAFPAPNYNSLSKNLPDALGLGVEFYDL